VYFLISTLCLLIIYSNIVYSFDAGQKLTITLNANNGDAYDIGWLTIVESKDNGYVYDVTLDDEKFEKHFLSMNPFQCLESPKMMVCHLPYPYQNNRFIADDNLTDLEYDLLFLHKEPGEYGIDAWNGIYYKMELSEGKITGVLHDVDLNVIKAPPEKGNLRPIKEKMLHKADLNKYWLPKLLIH
jgi:hypothetical protein